MPLYSTKGNAIRQLKKVDFKNERELQRFVENNLEALFDIRFLATEYSTGTQHWWRIDTLGIDENNSPVIIEYKWWEKSDIINQWLYYLDRLVDHEGDFKRLTKEVLKENIEVDFWSPRVLLIAQSFSKFDQHAINRMSENIELWSYSLYDSELFELKLTASAQARKSTSKPAEQISKVVYKDYSVEKHLEWKSDHIKDLFYRLQEKIFALEAEQKIEENPTKLYISYRTNKNFVYIHIQAKSIKVHMPMRKEEFNDPQWVLKELAKWVQLRWTYCEAVLNSMDELEYIVWLINQSYLQSV